MQTAIMVFLGLSVAMAWLGVIGLSRMRGALDRVHCVTFVNVAAGGAITVAAFLTDGISDRSLKILLIFVVNLVSGAAISHMTGRAVTQRDAET
jgi:multicomponent Na+:H+ antiporter subunit G